MTEIKITRRIALDRPYEYYELEASYDTVDAEGKVIIKDIEKMVALIMKATAPKESKPSKKAPKIPTKKPQSSEDIKITELQDKDKVNISVKLVKPIDPEKDIKAFINKTDRSAGKRCKVIVQDDSGKIQLTLFDEQIDLVQAMKENAWFKIENGYVKEWRGNLELVVGKYGKIESVYNG